jgi:hypothetical protein
VALLLAVFLISRFDPEVLPANLPQALLFKGQDDLVLHRFHQTRSLIYVGCQRRASLETETALRSFTPMDI